MPVFMAFLHFSFSISPCGQVPLQDSTSNQPGVGSSIQHMAGWVVSPNVLISREQLFSPRQVHSLRMRQRKEGKDQAACYNLTVPGHPGKDFMCSFLSNWIGLVSSDNVPIIQPGPGASFLAFTA